MPSDVWKHFNKSGNKAVCECGDEVSLGKSGTTTTCANHLKSVKHIEAMKDKNCGPSAPKKARTESVATLFSPGYSKQRSKDLVSDVTDFIVDSNLPFSIAESPFLRRLINNNYGLAKVLVCCLTYYTTF
uniref:BED-type domain-containing protein n=1 Tax=Ditylenchus dipsaci TaxID=166011 RepID=A0A915CMR9_9BILA